MQNPRPELAARTLMLAVGCGSPVEPPRQRHLHYRTAAGTLQTVTTADIFSCASIVARQQGTGRSGTVAYTLQSQTLTGRGGGFNAECI